jgi:hypothetical protein
VVKMPPATRVRAFLLVFTALFLFALILAIVSEFSDAAWIKTLERIGEGWGRLTFVCIAITFILVEGVPMLAAWVKREEIREAREQGRTEGRALEREAWLDWHNKLGAWEGRKAEAEREGRAFDEPRPAPPAGG